MKHLLATAALACAIAACSSEPASPIENLAVDNAAAPVGADTPPLAPTASNGSVAVAKPAKVAAVLALEGLGDLAIGRPVPAKSTWAERGGQIPGGCRTLSSPDYPGVYAIAEGGKVRRITAGQRSTIKLSEGIGVGATEAEVKKWFPSFRVEPHKYEAAPAKYLTAPNAPSGDSALRFEIGTDGKVSLIHIGTMPVLGYVEGCA